MGSLVSVQLALPDAQHIFLPFITVVRKIGLWRNELTGIEYQLRPGKKKKSTIYYEVPQEFVNLQKVSIAL